MKQNEKTMNRTNIESKTHTNFNKTIRIYRSDVEKMKAQIERRMSDIWDIYYFHKDLEQYPDNYGAEYLPAEDVWVEICRTHYLCDKADGLLEDECFDFVCVDADEWFDEWYFDERIEEGLIDKYYMLPNSDEVDEIFEVMKNEYQYTVTDLFNFYRFYAVDEKAAIA